MYHHTHAELTLVSQNQSHQVVRKELAMVTTTGILSGHGNLENQNLMKYCCLDFLQTRKIEDEVLCMHRLINMIPLLSVNGTEDNVIPGSYPEFISYDVGQAFQLYYLLLLRSLTQRSFLFCKTKLAL